VELLAKRIEHRREVTDVFRCWEAFRLTV
jgi:hypothetical protein